MVTVTILLAAGAGQADDDDSAGIRERGIVIQATKKTYLVVVPGAKEKPGALPVEQPDVYYGDGKTFYLQDRGLWEGPISTRPAAAFDFSDWRALYTRQRLETRDMKSWTTGCESRTKQLSLASESTARKVLAAGTFKRDLPGHEPIMLARASTGTTYYLVDHPHRPKDNNDYRLFIGKRGAMKQIKIKDLSVDSGGILLITAQGVMKIDDSSRTTLFGRDADHLQPLDRVSLSVNAKLVFGDLGVYRHENFGMMCDDL